MALEGKKNLEDVLMEMGIHKNDDQKFVYKKYLISSDTTREVVEDVRHLLDGLGIEQPLVEVKLVDNPTIQCADSVASMGR